MILFPLKRKRQESNLEAFGGCCGDNLFYVCSTLPPKSNVCLKTAIYYVNTLDQLIWLVDAAGQDPGRRAEDPALR